MSDYEESDFGDVKMEADTQIDLHIKRQRNCMYKMYEEGEQYFIDLVDSQEELEYDGFIRDKKIESIIEEAAIKREEDSNEILRSTATISMIDNEIKLIQLDPNTTFTDLPSLRDQYQSNLITRICNDTDVPSEEDAIMIYNISDTSVKTDMEKLILSVEDRKLTLIQQLKYQDCTVSEIKKDEESKSESYLGFELSISPNRSTSDKAIILSLALNKDIECELPMDEDEIYQNYLDIKIEGDSASALKKITKVLIKQTHIIFNSQISMLDKDLDIIKLIIRGS